MIALQKVSKAYKSKGVYKPIVKDLTFTFPTDRNVAIMGHNGVGKSTLMRMIAGTEQPDSGNVYRSSHVSWPLGFSGGFNGSMTGFENIRFLARIYNQNVDTVTAYVEAFSELGPSLRLPIKTYSSGMRARLAFGVSMAIDFQIYLIDEITAVGDETFRAKSKKVFGEKLESSLIIMISHSEAAIRAYCHCGLFLSRDGVHYYDDLDNLIADYKRFT